MFTGKLDELAVKSFLPIQSVQRVFEKMYIRGVLSQSIWEA